MERYIPVIVNVGRDEKGCLLSTEKKAAIDVDREKKLCQIECTQSIVVHTQ